MAMLPRDHYFYDAKYIKFKYDLRPWRHDWDDSMVHCFVEKGGTSDMYQFDTVRRWCHTQFGRGRPRWTYDTFGIYEIFFRDLSDAMVFRLRWC